jgi:DNA-binding response OmpR family regulator
VDEPAKVAELKALVGIIAAISIKRCSVCPVRSHMSKEKGAPTSRLGDSSHANAAPAMAAPLHAGFRVLILEGENAPESLLAEAIRSEVPEVDLTLTRGLFEARALASAKDFDLLIVDAHLSADLGRALLVGFQDRNPSAEIIVTASESWLGGSSAQGESHMLHVISTPINPLELIGLVRDCCERTGNIQPSVWADSEDGQFVVVLRRHTPVEVVQLKCLSAATTALDFIRPNVPGGRIWFDKGEVVHAETGSLGGEDAFVEMMNWPCGSIVEIVVPPPLLRTIRMPWQSLLMHAVHQADERRAQVVGA